MQQCLQGGLHRLLVLIDKTSTGEIVPAFPTKYKNDMITLHTSGATLTISTTYTGGEFLREIEIDGVFGHINNITKSGSFTTPTISLGGSSMALEFATKQVNRFDGADIITIQFDKPIEATNAFAHIQGFADGSSIKCQVPIIPEPGSVLLGAIGILLLLRRRR